MTRKWILMLVLVPVVVVLIVVAAPSGSRSGSGRRVCVTLRYPDGSAFQTACAATRAGAWAKAVHPGG